MNHINKYLRNFKQYKLASHKIWTVAPEERSNILKLDWNESTISPTPLVKERLKALIERGDFFNLYPATNNIKLYQLLSKYTNMPVENIQYFGSSDSLHEYIAKLYISVGDPVVILWPSYDNFRLTSEVNGGRIYYYEFNPDFSLDEDGFIHFIREKEASLVYLCNPNNPTGNLHSVGFIKKLIELFPETMFLVDEAYYEFTSPKTTCAKLVLDYENLLISRTMSKAFGIANFRFGYLIASEANIRYISTIRNPKNITTFAQEASCAVLEDINYMESYVKEVIEAREYFVSEIRRLNVVQVFDSNSNFVVVRFKNFDQKMEMFNFLSSKNIFVRAIDQSKTVHDCLRITIGKKDQMKIVITAFKEFYGK